LSRKTGIRSEEVTGSAQGLRKNSFCSDFKTLFCSPRLGGDRRNWALTALQNTFYSPSKIRLAINKALKYTRVPTLSLELWR